VKANSTTQDWGWNVSFWFAVSSPLLGILLGIIAPAILPSEQAMSIIATVFGLIILLFGFDPPNDQKAENF